MTRVRLPVYHRRRLRPLTEREQEIYGMLLDGCRNKQIAAELTLSIHTVRFHVANILHKFHVLSRYELLAHLLHVTRRHPRKA
jgi:DNA-binding CsgD family transcriptional regulator